LGDDFIARMFPSDMSQTRRLLVPQSTAIQFLLLFDTKIAP
jgi:hypothetical protein